MCGYISHVLYINMCVVYLFTYLNIIHIIIYKVILLNIQRDPIIKTHISNYLWCNLIINFLSTIMYTNS